MAGILLVNPPDLMTIEAQLPKKYDELRGPTPPLGLMYLSAYLKRTIPRVAVSIIDCPSFDLSLRDVEKVIEVNRPAIVGIYAMSPTLLDALAVAAAAKRLDRGIVTVLGGPHPTLYPRQSALYADIDYAVAGDGEIPFARLCAMILARERRLFIPNVFTKRSHPYETDPARMSNVDLDDLPFPDREALPVAQYRSVLTEHAPVTTMVSSRGCPYSCTYCIDRLFGGRPRYRSAVNVVAEMAACAKLGIREIFFYDDTFTLDRRRVLALCDEIERTGLKIAWNFRTRVELVDYEMLARAKAAGLREAHFGVESGSDAVLARLKRGYTVRDVERAFAIARDVGVGTLAYFMVGSPGETPETVRASIELARRIAPDFIHVTTFMLYPRTEVFAQAVKRRIVGEDLWERFAANPAPFTIPVWEEHIPRDELVRWVDRFYHAFYLSPRKIIRSLARTRSISGLAKNVRTAVRMLAG